MNKDLEISKEIEKLNGIFADMSEEDKKLSEGLIQNAAFMAVTLKELQAEVTAHGSVLHVQSGNGFDTVKDNPAQKAYTTMISRYAGVIQQLHKMLPKAVEEQEKDALSEWLDE